MERIHHDTSRTDGIRPVNHSLVVLQQRAVIIYHCLPGHSAHRLIPGPRMTLVRVIPVFGMPNDDVAEDDTASMGVHA